MKKHLQFMSIHHVHFSYPDVLLVRVPLCGRGAWWIRQTPSGLECSLVLMKIKSIISQKIKRCGSSEWSLLPSLLSAWSSAWASSSMSQAWPMIWLCFKDPELWKNLLSYSIGFLNSHLGIDPGQSDLGFMLMLCQEDWQAEAQETQTNYFG